MPGKVEISQLARWGPSYMKQGKENQEQSWSGVTSSYRPVHKLELDGLQQAFSWQNHRQRSCGMSNQYQGGYHHDQQQPGTSQQHHHHHNQMHQHQLQQQQSFHQNYWSNTKKQKTRQEEDDHHDVDFQVADEDLALAVVPGSNFNPKTRVFTAEELKPQPIIRKREMIYTPEDQKDGRYWEKRAKNNVAARRSREARRLKENQIALRAAYLEKQNTHLKFTLKSLNVENASIKGKVERLLAKINELESKSEMRHFLHN